MLCGTQHGAVEQPEKLSGSLCCNSIRSARVGELMQVTGGSSRRVQGSRLNQEFSEEVHGTFRRLSSHFPTVRQGWAAVPEFRE
jgi:hypothetical protein